MTWHLKFLRPEEKQTIELVGLTAGQAASFYSDLNPDGRRLSPSDAQRAREQLIALTICLRESRLNRLRERELRATISLMRMMQRGLGLALSDDADRRRRAIPREEIAEYTVPVYRFWRDL